MKAAASKFQNGESDSQPARPLKPSEIRANNAHSQHSLNNSSSRASNTTLQANSSNTTLQNSLNNFMPSRGMHDSGPSGGDSSWRPPKPSEVRANINQVILNNQQSVSTANPASQNSLSNSFSSAVSSLDKSMDSGDGFHNTSSSRPLKPSDIRAGAENRFNQFAENDQRASASGSEPSFRRASPPPPVSKRPDAATISAKVLSAPPLPSRPSNNSPAPVNMAPALPSRPAVPPRPGANKAVDQDDDNRPPQHSGIYIPCRSQTLSGVGRHASIPRDAERRYSDLFSQLDSDRDGFVDGGQVQEIWVRSGLDNEKLGRVWFVLFPL